MLTVTRTRFGHPRQRCGGLRAVSPGLADVAQGYDPHKAFASTKDREPADLLGAHLGGDVVEALVVKNNRGPRRS